MKKLILPIAAAAFFLASCEQSVKGNYSSIEPKGFASVADSLSDEQLIDVRTPSEFTAGHLEGATNLDWNGGQFEKEAGKLDKNKPVMVYCRTGGRSTEAAEWLKKEGFTKVYEMKSGITGWQAENFPVANDEVKTVAAQSNVEVTTAAYNTLVNSHSIVLVDFAAEWCGPCKRLSPRLDELKNEMGDKFKLVKLDSDRDARLADSMNITALPTLFLYKNGKVVWRNEGLVEKSVVAEQINKK
jgi:thioredoxin